MTIEMPRRYVIGFDPGRDKCGIACVRLPNVPSVLHEPDPPDCPANLTAAIVSMEVVDSSAAIAYVVQQCQIHAVGTLVIGDGTSSKYWHQGLGEALPQDVAIAAIDEYNSTQEARDRYWTLYPPRGWSRLVPAKLRSIPRPIDDIVAVILVERWWAMLLKRS